MAQVGHGRTMTIFIVRKEVVCPFMVMWVTIFNKEDLKVTQAFSKSSIPISME